MRRLRIRSLPEAFRSTGFFAMLLTLVVVLASCSSSMNVISGPGAQPAGKTVPPVTIQQLTGIPPGRAAELKAAMARSAGERDIGIVEGEFQGGSFSLTGDFQASSAGGEVKITYQWQLRDKDGVLVHSFDAVESAGLPSGSDPWTAVTPAVLDRIARASSESIAVKLSQMGYATRVSELWMPPAEYFAMAGPGAEREVDLETLNGPDATTALALATDGQGPEADVADAGSATQPAEPEVAAEEPPSSGKQADTPQVAESDPPVVTPETSNGKPEISAVAVLPVKGSPGGGNDELTSAMRRTLAAAGWPVVTKPQPNAITISGRVDVSTASGNQQDVSVRWVVTAPSGGKLGDVKQANRVPAGTLDTGWGEAAFAVAEGAAAGIFDIVKRYQ